ncbi:immunoglobulin mu heavy chain-like [Mobula birostris]|uniref:immunoglobulin mu heavy chain-like n=1 Tax=Mobula birostris TaxID=1983395 RepID=UPI003B27F982
MVSNIIQIQLLLLFAGSCLAGTNFRVSSAKMVATEGSPVSLQCRFSYQHDNRYFLWLYVPPSGGGALKKLLYWEPGSQQPIYLAGSTDRYLARKDIRRGTMSLQINRATSTDTTRYFCQITDNLWDVNATDWCGCGISLSVERMRSPDVRLQAPFQEGAVWSARATLICKAVGFYPESITFRWMVDRKSHSLPTEQDGPVRSSSGTYSASSQIHIPLPEWDRVGSVYCLVTHVSRDAPVVSVFQRKAVPAPQPPVTFLLRPPETPSGDGASVTVTCGATGFYPASVSFGWEVEGRPVTSGVRNTEPVRTPDGTYLAISTLNTPRSRWSSGARHTCLISHQQLDQPVRKDIDVHDWDPVMCASSPASHQSLTTPLTTEAMEMDSTTVVPAPQPPVTFLLRPPETPSGDGASVTLTCGATGFYPASVSFGWEVEGRLVTSGVRNMEPVRTPDGTYLAISTLNTPRSRWSSGARHTCLISHQQLDQPVRKDIDVYASHQSLTTPLTTEAMEIDLTTVVPAPQPPVTFLLRPPETPSGDGASVTLTCGATGFYPASVSFGWEVEGRLVTSGVRNTEPVRTPDGTYLAISTLNTPRSRWSSGARHTCLISHQQLDQPVIKDIDVYASHQSSTTPLTTEAMEIDLTTVVPAPQPPVTFLLRPPETPSGDGASVTLTCGATGFYPASVSFGWEVEGRLVTSGVRNMEPVRTPDGTYLAISTLNTPRSRWSSGARHTCLISHQQLDQPVIKDIDVYASHQSLTTPLTTEAMEMDLTTVEPCQPTWYLGEIRWLWIAAALAALVIYTSIVLCIFHGISTCRQRRRGSSPDSLWVNTDIPMEKIPADTGKGL